MNVEIDSEKLDKTLETLGDDELTKNILFKAVKSGAKIIQETAKSYFKQRMGESANHQSKYLKAPFADGIIMKGDKAYCEARVSILKDFRMKFFETGTNERYIKNNSHSDGKRGSKNKNTGKSNYRGVIKAKWFFKDARTSSEPLVNEAMMETINKELYKNL